MAGASIKIGASSSEFQKQMKEVTQQLKLVSSECGVATEKARLFGSSQDKLIAVQKELTAKTQAQNQMMQLYRDRITGINGEVEKQKSKQSELNGKIDEATKKYKESCDQTGKNSEESKKLKNELDGLKEEYARNEKAIEGSNKKLVDATTKMNNTEKAMLQNKKALEDVNKEIQNSKIDKLSENLDKVSESSGKVSNKLKPASTAIIGMGTASAAASITFEDSMAKVSTIADDTVVSYDDMKKAILELSDQTGISANSIADDVYNAISAGQSTADAVNFVQESTKLAKSGFAESGQALDLLTTTLNSYSLKADEVGKVSDTFIQIQNKGKTTVAELSASMGKIIPTANSMGVSLDQLGAGYALMTSKGIATAETTTYMNSLLNELGKSGTKASEALKKGTGKSFQELTKEGKPLGDVLVILENEAKKNKVSLADMFGSAEAGKAALVLATDSGKAFNGLLGDMKNSLGSTDAAFEKVSNTTGNKLKQSLNQVKNTGISMGDALAPVISMVANGFSFISKMLSSLSETQLKTIAGIGGGIVTINLAFGAFSKLTGGISSGIKAYKTFRENGAKAIESISNFSKNALNATKTAANFATSIGKNMVNATVNGAKAVGNLALNLGKATIAFAKSSVQAGISAAKFVAHKVATIATTIATKAMSLAQAALNFVMALNPIVLIIGLLVALGATFVILYNKCDWFKNGVQDIWNKITEVFNKFDNFLSGIFSTDWTESFGVFGNILNAFFQNLSNIWDSIKSIFSGVIDFVVGVFTGDWSRAWEGVKGIFGGIMSGLGAVMKAPLNAVIGLINMAIDGINSISFTTPDWIPFVGGKHFGASLPKINYLYRGGIINSPTLLGSTVVGDAFNGQGSNAEAVIPLDSMYRNLREIVRSELGGETVIYTTNVFNVDGKELKRETAKEVINSINRSTNNYKKSKGAISYA